MEHAADSDSQDEDDVLRLDYRAPRSLKPAVQFVRAKSDDIVPTAAVATSGTSSSLGDSYLALVLPTSQSQPQSLDATGNSQLEKLCPICNLPLSNPMHETSIAHQVRLPHSHPPSSVDRTRKGLAYLQSYGWDPDSRVGLGARQEGMLHPVKAKEKKDKSGIGILPRDSRPSSEPPPKVEKLNPKQAKKMYIADKKKAARLQRIFHGNDDLEKYLGDQAYR
jgi:hypothetical protein